MSRLMNHSKFGPFKKPQTKIDPSKTDKDTNLDMSGFQIPTVHIKNVH